MGGSKKGRSKDTREKSLGLAAPTVQVTLADGNLYTLGPMNMNLLIEFEETHGQTYLEREASSWPPYT